MRSKEVLMAQKLMRDVNRFSDEYWKGREKTPQGLKRITELVTTAVNAAAMLAGKPQPRKAGALWYQKSNLEKTKRELLDRTRELIAQGAYNSSKKYEALALKEWKAARARAAEKRKNPPPEWNASMAKPARNSHLVDQAIKRHQRELTPEDVAELKARGIRRLIKEEQVDPKGVFWIGPGDLLDTSPDADPLAFNVRVGTRALPWEERPQPRPARAHYRKPAKKRKKA